MQIETESISSNTEIEANMISKIFANSVVSVVDNLRLISNSPSVQNEDSSGIYLLGLAEHNTANLTDFYVWFDREGKIIGTSSAVDGTDEQLARDLSNSASFSIPEITTSLYVSNVTFFEGIPRMFISVPIVDRNTNDKQINDSTATADNNNILTNISTPADGIFEGIIAVAIKVDELGEYLQNLIPPKYSGFVGVASNRGTILSSANLSHIGKNIFDTDLNPIIPDQAKGSFNLQLNQSLF